MKISSEKVEKISLVIIKVLFSRFQNFPENALDNKNEPFHEAFLNAFSNKFEGKVVDVPFFISMSSWLHGLKTTLGSTFFEKAAHILSDGEKREYTSKKLGNLNLSTIQKNNINMIITDLSTGRYTTCKESENGVLFKLDDSEQISAMDFSADVFIEDENEITAIEIKSVRPNSGEMRGEKHKILEGKCALYNENPGKKINFLLGFPFDPTADSPTNHNKEKFMNSIINLRKYFDKDEILLASELWDFLSGTENTMGFLLEIINGISTPEFIEKYRFINNVKNIGTSRYLNYLKEWNLHSQLLLLEKDESIRKAIKDDKRLIKIYNQQIFKDGEYNYNRFEKLSKLI